MRGIIQFLNTAKHSGVLLAKDGSTYGFTLFDCVPGTQPRIGDIVEFDIQDGVAVEVGGSSGNAPERFNIGSVRQTVTAQPAAHAQHFANPQYAAKPAAVNTPSPRQIVSPGGSAGPLARLANDWRNVFAALILAACLLPFFSYMGVSSNLFGAVSYTGDMVSAAETMKAQSQKLMATLAPQGLAGSGGSQAQLFAGLPGLSTKEIGPSSTMIWFLRSAYMLLAIPFFAVLTLAASFRGRSNALPAMVGGGVCASLPVIAIAADRALSAFKSQIFMGELIPSLMSTVGIGFYVLTAVGVAMLLVQFGLIGRRPPSAYLAAYAQ